MVFEIATSRRNTVILPFAVIFLHSPLQLSSRFQPLLPKPTSILVLSPILSVTQAANHSDGVPLCAAISSAMMMYRVISLCSLRGDDDPWPARLDVAQPENSSESVWHAEVKHKKSGATVRFGDYLGGAVVWLLTSGDREQSETLREDLTSLLQLLCSRRCPHTSGCLAGCVYT